mmetsp:Transcript_143168/g.399002  ORF Transcript_143168/g.399002 Transcript_143168/m.399002 type:complete len:237 (+) Transcript_143168:297-1007(+)
MRGSRVRQCGGPALQGGSARGRLQLRACTPQRVHKLLPVRRLVELAVGGLATAKDEDTFPPQRRQRSAQFQCKLGVLPRIALCEEGQAHLHHRQPDHALHEQQRYENAVIQPSAGLGTGPQTPRAQQRKHALGDIKAAWWMEALLQAEELLGSTLVIVERPLPMAIVAVVCDLQPPLRLPVRRDDDYRAQHWRDEPVLGWELAKALDCWQRCVPEQGQWAWAVRDEERRQRRLAVG